MSSKNYSLVNVLLILLLLVINVATSNMIDDYDDYLGDFNIYEGE